MSTSAASNQTHTFRAHQSARARELDGQPLASFPQRLFGYVIDLAIAILIWAPLEIAWRRLVLREENVNIRWDFHQAGNIIVVVLYYGIANYLGNGQTPGKWMARTRAVSLTHPRMGFWQSIERALGYGAAVLECGLGFLQYFWSENHMCAQDRLAETVVIDVRKRRP